MPHTHLAKSMRSFKKRLCKAVWVALPLLQGRVYIDCNHSHKRKKKLEKL